MSAFFAQWLDRKGAPALKAGAVHVSRREDGQFEVTAEVLQDGEPWKVKVPVRVEWAEGFDQKWVDLDGSRAEVKFMLTRPPAKVSVDPEFHVFRLVPIAEIQPCLNLTLEGKDKVYVVPEGSEGYRKLAEMAVARKGGEIVTAGEAFPEKDCILFGRPEDNPAVAKVLAAAGIKVEGNAVTIRGRKHESDEFWLLWSDRHPTLPGKFVTVFFGTTEKALAGGRAIYHYGWDGFVAYAGRPLDRGDNLKVAPASESRVTLPADEAAVGRTLSDLEAPEVAGRLAGSPADAAVRALLAKRLTEAGATGIREVPFSFTVLDFADPDAWTVAQGELSGGTQWKTAYPGAVVPAVFSAECPDGVRISKIARMPAEAAEGLLLMVPAEAELPALLAKVREAVAAKPAAVGIPMEVLAQKGFAELAGYPGRQKASLPDASAMQTRALEAAGDLAACGIPVVFVDARLLPPVPVAEADATLRVRFARTTVESANLVAVLPDRRGNTEGAAVAIGAHFDSLGEGYAGADDNASGVAAVIEAARLLNSRRDLLGAPVKVMLFSAEEWGLKGSAALVASEAKGLRAFLNPDTVGAKDVPDMFLIGRSAHPSLAATAEAFAEAAGFAVGRDIDKFAFRMGSDHWSFHLAGVPSIDLFSGQYRRMNTTDDAAGLVDAGKVARVASALALMAVDQSPAPPRAATMFPGEETSVANVRMLTLGGENAEAYFPAEDDRLVFQSKRGGIRADQIFTMNLDGSGLRLVSNGRGVTTCSYLFPGSRRAVYATTMLAGDDPPPPPDYSHGYVWKLHPEYDIVAHDLDGRTSFA